MSTEIEAAPGGADIERATGDTPATPERSTTPRRTIALGTVGSVMMLLGGLGAAAGAVNDPFMSDGPISWLRFGHGKMLSTVVVYAGVVLLVWAWVRLGRLVLAGRVGTRPVVWAAVCWIAPMLLAPAMFTRDVYSYLAQGATALAGFDVYRADPTVLSSPELIENVHPFWLDQPAPYGPFFILLAKGTVWLTGPNILGGALLMRLVLVAGFGLLLWALPGLVRHLGGRLPVAAWGMLAGPLTVVHLVGGPHNDLLLIGCLAAGTLLMLDGRHVAGFALATLAVGVKASALVALPFLVWVWAGHLNSTRWRNFARACTCAVATFVVVLGSVSLLAGVDYGWIREINASAKLVNWLSMSTASGEILHSVLGIAIQVPADWVITVTRLIGQTVLLVLLIRMWWRARDGGPGAVRLAAFGLLAVSVLSPTLLPWYLSWGLVLAAGLPWKPRQLAVFVAISVFMVAPYSADGEQLLYVWGWVFLAVAASVLAAVSLVRPDPLRWSHRTFI
ncbi:polyprenol phosphomannose-dependent alpha 1,6 mannosyltransferase MptB [Actinophytocola sp.]|uniref:polyprenol phosphomannose-dependent alpha 1,6 mannosyltransferase MptB n=1 Tax=Actinophytocola sp. TaxID=1872138 RepID=UPI003D6A48A5